MRAGIVGAGYVGLASGLVLCELGHAVTFYDVDSDRIALLRAGVSPFFEPGLEPALAEALSSGRATFTNDASSLASCDVVIVAVPTHVGADARYGLDALRSVVMVLDDLRREGPVEWRMVIVRSTVSPGTTRALFAPLSAASPGGRSCGLAYVPEFLREGSALADARRPDRIVVGADDARTHALVRELYLGLETTHFETHLETAELVKQANNAMLATCISFANEIARTAEAIGGVDALDVFDALYLDRRLRGPALAGIAEYLRPGPGFGGSCLVKDLDALRAFAGARAVETPLLDAVAEVNATQPLHLVQRVADALDGLDTRRVTVLGLAFKPGTDDVRSSIAIPVVRALVAGGAIVRGHDPRAATSARRALGSTDIVISHELDIAALLAESDAWILLTTWPAYLDALSRHLADRTAPLLFVDARGAFRGIAMPSCVTYLGVGVARTQEGERNAAEPIA